MIENFGIDYKDVVDKLYGSNNVKPVKGNEDKMIRVAFDFFKLRDDDPETLWQVQKADDGQEYLMRTFSDDESNEKLKTESNWDVQLNKEATNLTIYKSEVPVHRMDLGKMNIERGDSEGFRAFVLGKLRREDSEFLQKLAMEMPLTKISALKESGIVDLDDARTKAEWAVLKKNAKLSEEDFDFPITLEYTVDGIEYKDSIDYPLFKLLTEINPHIDSPIPGVEPYSDYIKARSDAAKAYAHTHGKKGVNPSIGEPIEAPTMDVKENEQETIELANEVMDSWDHSAGIDFSTFDRLMYGATVDRSIPFEYFKNATNALYDFFSGGREPCVNCMGAGYAKYEGEYGPCRRCSEDQFVEANRRLEMKKNAGGTDFVEEFGSSEEYLGDTDELTMFTPTRKDTRGLTDFSPNAPQDLKKKPFAPTPQPGDVRYLPMDLEQDPDDLKDLTDYDLESLVKNIYKKMMSKKPSSNQHSPFDMMDESEQNEIRATLGSAVDEIERRNLLIEKAQKELREILEEELGEISDDLYEKYYNFEKGMEPVYPRSKKTIYKKRPTNISTYPDSKEHMLPMNTSAMEDVESWLDELISNEKYYRDNIDFSRLEDDSAKFGTDLVPQIFRILQEKKDELHKLAIIASKVIDIESQIGKTKENQYIEAFRRLEMKKGAETNYPIYNLWEKSVSAVLNNMYWLNDGFLSEGRGKDTKPFVIPEYQKLINSYDKADKGSKIVFPAWLNKNVMVVSQFMNDLSNAVAMYKIYVTPVIEEAPDFMNSFKDQATSRLREIEHNYAMSAEYFKKSAWGQKADDQFREAFRRLEMRKEAIFLGTDPLTDPSDPDTEVSDEDGWGLDQLSVLEKEIGDNDVCDAEPGECDICEELERLSEDVRHTAELIGVDDDMRPYAKKVDELCNRHWGHGKDKEESGFKEYEKGCRICGYDGPEGKGWECPDCGSVANDQEWKQAFRRLELKKESGSPAAGKSGGHKSPPKGYPKDKSQYADPKNYKYPIDTEKHVRVAYSYLSQKKNQKGYSPAEISTMMGKIKSAGKKYDIKYSEADDQMKEAFRRLELRKQAGKKKKAIYSAIFLPKDQEEGLLDWWKKETGLKVLPKIFAHHMTIKFKPSPEEVMALPIGQDAGLKIIGWVADEKGQTILVEPEVPSTNSNPHITIATDGTSPVYSNELIQNGEVNMISGPTLKGRVGIFNGGGDQFDLINTIYENIEEI